VWSAFIRSRIGLFHKRDRNFREAAEPIVFPVEREALVDGKFRFAEGIAFNGEGRLYVTADDALWEVMTDGDVKRLADLHSCLGIAPIGERDILVADFGPKLAIRHGPNNDGLILADDERTLYVAQIFKSINPVVCDDRVWRIPLRDGRPAGEPEVAFATGGVGCNDGLAMDAEGRIYVAANREGRIWRFDPAGGPSVVIAKQDAASIAFGAGKFDRHSIYLAELKGGRILKVPVGVSGAELNQGSSERQ